MLGGDDDFKLERALRDVRYIASHKKTRNVNVIFYGIGAQATSGVSSFIQHSNEIVGDTLESVILAGDSRDEAIEATRLIQIHLKESQQKIPRTKIVAVSRENIQDQFEHFDTQKKPFTILVMSHSKPLVLQGTGDDERIAQTRENIEVIDELKDLLGTYRPDHILCVSNLPEALMYRMGQTYDMDLRRFSGCSHLDKLRFDLAMAEHLANLGNSDMKASSRNEIQSLLRNWEIWDKTWFGAGYHGNVWPVFIDGYVENGREILSLRRLGFDLSQEDKYELSKKIALLPEEQVNLWKKSGKRKPRAPTDSGNAIRNTLLAIINESGWVNNSIAYKPFRNSDQVLFLALPVRYRDGLAYYDQEYLTSSFFTKADKKEFYSRATELQEFIASVDRLMAGDGTLEYSGNLDETPDGIIAGVEKKVNVKPKIAKKSKIITKEKPSLDDIDVEEDSLESPELNQTEKEIRQKTILRDESRNPADERRELIAKKREFLQPPPNATVTMPPIANYRNLEAKLRAGVKEKITIPEGHIDIDFIIPVLRGGTLDIKPGAKIPFTKNGGIAVQGGTLLARGEGYKPVILGEGPWLGISFYKSLGNELYMCVINNASKYQQYSSNKHYLPAVEIEDSEVHFLSTEFNNCAIGAVYAHRADCQMSDCQITDYGRPLDEALFRIITKREKNLIENISPAMLDADSFTYGAVISDKAKLTVGDCHIVNGYGTAIKLDCSYYYISQSKIINTKPVRSAIDAYKSRGSICGGEFKDNISEEGSTLNMHGGTIEISMKARFENNQGIFGGAIHITAESQESKPLLNDIEIIGNTAEVAGGLYTQFSRLTLKDSIVGDNTARDYCGGVGYGFAEPNISGSSIRGNRPDDISLVPQIKSGVNSLKTSEEEYLQRVSRSGTPTEKGMIKETDMQDAFRDLEKYGGRYLERKITTVPSRT